MAARDLAVIVSACRTAIGSFGGTLKDLSAPQLGPQLLQFGAIAFAIHLLRAWVVGRHDGPAFADTKLASQALLT